MNFGIKLRQLRNQLNLTQVQVAEALHISLRSYAAYELGERLPRTIDDYAKIAEFYKVPMGFLYDEVRHKQTQGLLIREKRAVLNEAMDIIASTLEKEGWFTKQSEDVSWDLEAYCPQREEWLMVDVKLFKTQSGAKILRCGLIFQTYGKLTVNKIDKLAKVKVLVVTNSQDFIRLATANPPVNLSLGVSIRWLDMQAKVLGDYIELVK